MPTSGNAPVILVIEGDETTRNFLVEALHWAGFAVVAATTGSQALATVESRVVGLVVSGSHLRGLGGAEVLRKMRDREARHRLPPIPFIMLSGDLDLSAAVHACRLSAPVNVGELVSTVSAMLVHPQAVRPLPLRTKPPHDTRPDFRQRRPPPGHAAHG